MVPREIGRSWKIHQANCYYGCFWKVKIMMLRVGLCMSPIKGLNQDGVPLGIALAWRLVCLVLTSFITMWIYSLKLMPFFQLCCEVYSKQDFLGTIYTGLSVSSRVAIEAAGLHV